MSGILTSGQLWVHHVLMTLRDPMHRALAAHVAAVIRRSAMTQADVALHLGLSRVAVSDRMRAETRWGAVELQRLAGALGISVAELFQPATGDAA